MKTLLNPFDVRESARHSESEITANTAIVLDFIGCLADTGLTYCVRFTRTDGKTSHAIISACNIASEVLEALTPKTGVNLFTDGGALVIESVENMGAETVEIVPIAQNRTPRID